MIRLVPATALAVLATFAPLAQAQRGTHGPHAPPPPLPLSPGVFPGSSIGPGTQFLPQPTPQFVPGRHGWGTTQYLRPGATIPYYGQGASFNRGGWGYGYGYSYGYGSYGSGYGGYDDGYYDFGPPHLPARSAPNIALANVFPATLTVQLPAGAKPAEYVLTSPELNAGDPYTFAVNVRWESGGKTYEAKRSVTLNSGARSRIHILSGDEVKE